MRTRNGIRVGILGLFIVAAMLIPGVALAADFTVTTTADGDDKECAQDCTLREAVVLAGPNDRVLLPSGNYQLTMGELSLIAEEIVGAGARTTAIDGAGNSRVLLVNEGTTLVSGVSILRGNGESEVSNGLGGGILVQSGTLQLTNVSVRGNTADNGGGIAALGSVFLFNSTVSGNSASALRLTSGGGIVVASDGALGLINSTITGNTANGTGSRGGGVFISGQFAINYSTIANNTAADGNFTVTSTDGTRSIINSILAAPAGDACSGAGIGSMTATNDVADDSSCQLKDPSNRNNANPALGSLANNGGPTDTLALGAASAAINAAGTCTSQDQRGVTRPQTGSTCDSGAFEYRAPTLLVTTTVTNDDGGTRTAADFTVHVREGGGDVKGSPQAGSVAGSTYTLDAGGSYVVAAEALAGYTITVGGDCSAAGSITLAEGQNRTCTITANDIAPTLRVITGVTTDNGGTLTPAGVNVHVRRNGVELAGSPAAGVAGPTGRLYTTTVGPHAVTADAVSGYTISYSAGCTVTLALAQNATCTVTLDDVAPTLRVITAVANDNGGTLAPGGVNVHARRAGVELAGSPAAGVAGPNGRLYTTSTGAHTVTADAVSGYTISYSAGCTVTLALDDDATCTVTLNDIAPTLKVVTEVFNDANGPLDEEDFTVHVRRGATDVDGSPHQGTAAGRDYTLDAGNYVVSVEAQPGYVATMSGGCAANGAVTLALDEDKTCSVRLDDGAALLDVVTNVDNDDGGSLAADDFTVRVRSAGVDVPGSPAAGNEAGKEYQLGAGAYTVAADATTGYTFALSGHCAANGTITLALLDERTCTVTAEDVAPRLTVVTRVNNDNGGTATPASLSVHVRGGGADIAGSPQPGDASGTVHTLTAGAYTVAADAPAGYTRTTSGDCAPTLAVGDSRTCTITADDDPPPVRGQASNQLPPPEPGKSVNAEPKSGTVKVKPPGAKAYVALNEAQQLPVGTIIDATKGHVTLIAAADQKGGTATAEFWAGIFRLGQTKGATPITTLTLVEKLSCPKRGKASIAAKKKKKRRLWGDGSGKFRTEGQYSSATVRGTRWLVEDRCTSTLTRVVRGRVAVRDFVKRKTVVVRAGKKYVAKAKRS